MNVLAIDPGYDRVGLAVLEQDTEGGAERVLYSDCFVTERTLPFTERLHLIGKEVDRLICEYTPHVFALEKLYFSTNQKTAMAVSEARGVFLYVAASHKLPIFEYTPLQIKNAVTGSGKSDKKQVMRMVEQLVTLSKPIKYDDEYDAIAIGITCLASEKLL